MNYNQYANVSSKLKEIISLIGDLTGFPSDDPWGYKKSWKDPEERALVKKELEAFKNAELKFPNSKSNAEQTAKMIAILDAIINSL